MDRSQESGVRSQEARSQEPGARSQEKDHSRPLLLLPMSETFTDGCGQRLLTTSASPMRKTAEVSALGSPEFPDPPDPSDVRSRACSQ